MYYSKILAASAAFLCLHNAGASDLPIDSVYAEYGSASKVQMVRAGATSRWNGSWFEADGRRLVAYTDASVGAWHGTRAHGVNGAHQNLLDIGLTPVFRYQNDSGLGFFAEGGIGIHLLSKLYDNNDDKLSTAFQFGDHIGAGYVFNKNWSVTVKYQHFSNGGIKSPNSGADFAIVRLNYKF